MLLIVVELSSFDRYKIVYTLLLRMAHNSTVLAEFDNAMHRQ